MNILQIVILFASRVFLGSLCTLISKWQKLKTIGGYTFNHPTIHAFISFAGEIFITSLWIYISKPKQAQKYEKRSCTGLLILSGVIIGIETPLSSLALYYSPASVFQMTKSMLSVYVLVLSIVLLKEKVKGWQIIGVLVILVGIGFIILTEMLRLPKPMQPNTSSLRLLGIILCLLAQLFHAFVIIIQDYVIRHYEIHYASVIQQSGLYAMIFTILVTFPALSLIKCVNPKICQFTEIENLSIGLQQFRIYKILIVQCAFLIICYGVCSILGLLISKEISAIARSSIENIKSALIWVICMLAHWEDFIFLELLGFLLICYGTLLYNRAKIEENSKKIKNAVLYH